MTEQILLKLFSIFMEEGVGLTTLPVITTLRILEEEYELNMQEVYDKHPLQRDMQYSHDDYVQNIPVALANAILKCSSRFLSNYIKVLAAESLALRDKEAKDTPVSV